MDVLLIYSEKFLVFWNPEKNGWFFSPMDVPEQGEPFLHTHAIGMKRLGSYFELA